MIPLSYFKLKKNVNTLPSENKLLFYCHLLMKEIQCFFLKCRCNPDQNLRGLSSCYKKKTQKLSKEIALGKFFAGR